MTPSEIIRELDAFAQIAAFILATAFPLLAAVAAFLLSDSMPLIWRAVVVIGANVISFPAAFILVMLVVAGWPPSGTPGTGVAALPMLLVWLLAAAASVVLLIGLVVGRVGRRSP